MPDIEASPPEPYAVDIREARRLLGNKGRTQIYEAITAGELDAIKDGTKTLITLASIKRRQEACIKPRLRRRA